MAERRIFFIGESDFRVIVINSMNSRRYNHDFHEENPRKTHDGKILFLTPRWEAAPFTTSVSSGRFGTLSLSKNVQMNRAFSPLFHQSPGPWADGLGWDGHGPLALNWLKTLVS